MIDPNVLRNPVWRRHDQIRDPGILPLKGGYRLYYTRCSGPWSKEECMSVASVFTRDFTKFTDDRDITPKGYASPGDPVAWHGRYIIPYQLYTTHPNKLYFSESADAIHWADSEPFLPEANELAWNTKKRAIDPTFVVDADKLHCFFAGSCIWGTKHANLLGHAVSTDPTLKAWKVLTPDTPVIGQSAEAPDGVENIAVVRVDDMWLMIYSEGMMEQHLALATSSNLLDWKLQGRIELPVQSWMKRRYGAPAVWKEAERWWMILMGQDKTLGGTTTFGLLYSPDAVHWTLLPEAS